MCGFLFVASRGAPIDQTRFEDALAQMTHRGPDFRGLRFEEHTIATPGGPLIIHAGFGHQRLSILDLDPRSNQPFSKGPGTLLFNGEIYNFAALKRDAALADAGFGTTGDTEVLYEILSRKADRTFGDMNGFWSFVYFDPESGAITLSRDRYGKKPLYIYQDDTLFCAGSTVASIMHYLGRPARFRPQALTSFLAHGICFPGAEPETHFDGIGQVPPRSRSVFSLADWSIAHRPYTHFSDRIVETPPDIAQTLRDSVRLRLVSDRNVGLLLSGGVDSTAVLAALYAEGLHENLTCFIGETGRSEDAAYAQRCVEQLGIEARTITLEYDAGAFARFLKTCRHFEKPFPILGNSMAMSEMYERIAEHDVTVVIDGTGGDELFGGYWDRQFPTALREARKARDTAFLAAARSTGKRYRDATGLGALSEIAKKTALAIPFVTHRSKAVQIYCSDAVRRASSMDPLDSTFDHLTDLMITDAERGRLGEWLVHNDRNAMMASLENRSPLLDYRLIPYLGTGYARKFVGEWNKHELRSAFDGLVQLPTQWRSQKQGFRWASKRFYQENKPRIAELIRASAVLADHMDVARFCDDVMRSERLVNGRLAQRALSVAGLEAEMGLRA